MTLIIQRRVAWGAQPPRTALKPVAPHSRVYAFLHYSLGEELGDRDSGAWLRNIQRYHVEHNGWSDIGYNLAVDNRGVVWEGRGLDVVGAHCPDYNTLGYGVVYLGDDDPGVTDVSIAAKTALRDVFAELDRRSDRQLIRLGHRNRRNTRCPGDELYAWLRAGMPVHARVPKPPANNQPAALVAPEWPLPSGHWFGRSSADKRNHSGYYSRIDRHHLARLQVQLVRIGIRCPTAGFFDEETERAVVRFDNRPGVFSGIRGKAGAPMWKAAWEMRSA